MSNRYVVAGQARRGDRAVRPLSDEREFDGEVVAIARRAEVALIEGGLEIPTLQGCSG